MNKVITTIMTHTNFMDRALRASVQIYEYALTGDVDLVNESMENRERLISILQKLQEIITLNLQNLNHDQKVEANIFVNAWSHDLSEWIETISEIDSEVVKLLNQQKEKTTEDISSTYTNHKKFKGYNLKSVK